MTKNRWLAGIGVIFLALCLVQAGTAAGAKDEPNAKAGFEKLKSLVGTWEATSDKGKTTSSFELVAGGTAVLERVNIPGHDQMLTIYHLDGDHLLLTHYCTAGNHPTMQAQSFDAAGNQLRFQFVSATNLAGANAGHMHQAVVKFTGADTFEADWTWNENGQAQFTVPLQYHRVR